MARKISITYTLTNEDIRFEIERAAAELEEDNQVRFPDSEAREEFIQDCTECVMDKAELYELDYRPDYALEILDMAKLYNYLTD